MHTETAGAGRTGEGGGGWRARRGPSLRRRRCTDPFLVLFWCSSVLTRHAPWDGHRFHVKFVVKANDDFMEQLRVCGTTEALGGMDPEKGVPLVRPPSPGRPAPRICVAHLPPRVAHSAAWRRSRSTGWGTTGRRCAPSSSTSTMRLRFRRRETRASRRSQWLAGRV